MFLRRLAVLSTDDVKKSSLIVAAATTTGSYFSLDYDLL
jgi:hypothetical protein